MTIVYIKGLEPTKEEKGLIDSLSAPSLRCGQYWKGEVEKASTVYTDVDRIADKYKRRNVQVEPVTPQKPKPAPKQTRKPKRATRAKSNG